MTARAAETVTVGAPGTRDFRLYWSADAVDRLGTQMSQIALPLLLLDAGGSAARAGLMATLAGAGGVAAGPVAAALADGRWRGPMMRWSSLAAATAMGWATLTVLGHRICLPCLVGALLVERVAASCFEAAAAGSVARLVPPEWYPRAVARLQGGEQGGAIAGPALAGLLLRQARALPFLADTVSYLAAAFLVRAIRTDLAPPAASDAATVPGQRFGRRTVAGVGFVRTSPFLRFLLVWSCGVNALLALLSYTTVFVVHAAHGSASVGLVLGAAAGAGLLGSLLAPVAVRRVRGGVLVVALSWLTVPAAAGLALAGPAWVCGALLGLVALLVPSVAVVLHARAVRVVPQHLQARVATVAGTATAAVAMAAPALAGALTDTVGPATVDLACAAGLALLALYAATGPAARLDAPATPVEAAPDDPSALERG
ncbi:MFS transporter [Streptomyces sp. PTM05]|uniref:MFS transporter n=1 Tax=Streptantibioticus parmotrematis TaxID=2873249 RepID=A0ABS7QXF9_9ACTN|nr:MFS transporter [Streptantibioticus parmotrematis]MBY8887890.1 MFS transporter [Streptantibioticus parmotrematis]